MQIIDLSVPLENNPFADPPGFGPSVVHQTHAETAEAVIAFFPGLTVDDLPGGEGWAIEQVRLNTHNGTHLDAPYHFHSTMSKGESRSTRFRSIGAFGPG
jgi:kynurenine formamidase